MTAANTSMEHTAPREVHAASASRPFCRIVLTGFMGAGKTTVGQVLAEQLGWEFLDLDRHIEQRTGRSVAQIFAEDGETRFRRMESAALANALCRQDSVLALGGGVPDTLTNRLLLEQTPGTLIVFLDAPFPVLFDRCMLQSVDRPNLRDSVAASARFAARLPLYQRLSRLTIDTESRTVNATVQTIAEALATIA